VGKLILTIRGLAHLVMMAAWSGFALRGRYWSWRRSTAMGSGAGVSRQEARRGVLEYARWIARMRT
jgi:hypothetical protein